MLNWKLEYDVCALITAGVFTVYYFLKPRFKSFVNKIYTWIVVLNLVNIIVEIMATHVIADWFELPVWADYLSSTMMMYVNSILCYLFSVYIILGVREGKYTEKTWYWFLAYSPALFNVLMILTTFLTGAVFWYDESGSYHNGPLLGLFYAILLLYIAGAGLIALINYKKFSRENRIAITLFISLIIGSVILRAFAPGIMLTCMVSTIGVLSMYLAAQNPQDTIGQISGLYNRKALLMRINELRNHGTSFSAIVMTPDGLDAYYENYGYVIGDCVQKHLSDAMIQVTNKDSSFVIGGGKYVLLLASDDMAYVKMHDIKALFEKPCEFKGKKFELTTSMCPLSYPDDFDEDTSTEQIINMLETAAGMATQKGKGIILSAQEYIDSREKMIGYLEKQQLILENKTRIAEQAREEAERADKSKSSFLASMSHEIRTPMTAILGMTEILLRDDLPADTKQSLVNIQNAGRSLLSLINDILDFSKIEAGRMEIVNDKYQIISTIDDVINMVKLRLQHRDIELFTYIDPHIPYELIGDENRLRQLMLNILNNAAKYTKEGKIILRIFWNNEIERLTVSVKDTGRGIKKENLDKLFDSFERFDTKNNKAIEGTGLGLSICKKLLEIMDGSIEVESTYGEGSTFTFYLHQSVSKAQPLISIENSESMNVLSYLKSKDNADSLKYALKGMNIKHTNCSDLIEYIKLFESGEFTHVILDRISYEEYKPKDKNHMSIYILCEEYNSKAYEVRIRKDKCALLMLPISCMSIATAFTGNMKDSNSTYAKLNGFTAPEARVLVIDDNYVNLQLAKKLMAPHKMKVDIAESGQDGLYLSEIYKYDLIFMDHMMPVMDGVETLSELRKRRLNPNVNTSVIAFTANAVSGVKEELISNGFTDYLSKPISVERLEGLLRKYLPNNMIIEDTDDDTEKVVVKPKEHHIKAEEFARSNLSHRYYADIENEMVERIEEENHPFVIPGVNVEKGIVNVGDDLENYLNVLKLILTDGKKKIERIDKLYNEKDYHNYTIEVHALKSNMATIGADKLSYLAKDLELAGKSGDLKFIDDNHSMMINKYGTILKDIENNVNFDLLLGESQDSEPDANASSKNATLNDDEEVIAILKNTIDLIHEFKYDLAQEEMKKIFDFKLERKDELKAIFDKFEMFDYDEVANDLEEFLSK